MFNDKRLNTSELHIALTRFRSSHFCNFNILHNIFCIIELLNLQKVLSTTNFKFNVLTKHKTFPITIFHILRPTVKIFLRSNAFLFEQLDSSKLVALKHLLHFLITFREDSRLCLHFKFIQSHKVKNLITRIFNSPILLLNFLHDPIEVLIAIFINNAKFTIENIRTSRKITNKPFHTFLHIVKSCKRLSLTRNKVNGNILRSLLNHDNTTATITLTRSKESTINRVHTLYFVEKISKSDSKFLSGFLTN